MTNKRSLPTRWSKSAKAIQAVQVAFDVEERVLEAVRREACRRNLTPSDQIREIVGLTVAKRPKRPRLTLSLNQEDYAQLAQRYGLNVDDRLGIKEAVTQELVTFAERKKS